MRLLFIMLSLIGLVGCGSKVDVEEARKVEVVDQIAALEKSGATITRDSDGKVTIEMLNNTQITGEGLEHPKGLTNLVHLGLTNTQISDAGLENLKGLPKLEALYLSDTQVTDDGLEHLKGLTNLDHLELTNTHAPVIVGKKHMSIGYRSGSGDTNDFRSRCTGLFEISLDSLIS